MAEYRFVVTEKNAGTALLTINNPASLNALNAALLQELKKCVLELQEDADVKVIIITGAGEKAFVAGADIAEMAIKTPAEGKEFGLMGQAVFTAVEQLEKPVIAAVNGFALGGGCELAMACDIRIAAERAKFGQPEVNIGVIPGFGGTQRMLRLIGIGAAKMLIMSGRVITAQEALRLGLVDMVTGNDKLLEEARKLAADIIGKSPNAVRLAKQAINAGYENGLEKSLAFEAEKFGECFQSPEQKEGMEAFLQKRPAKF